MPYPFFEATTPGAAPGPRSKPRPVFVASGGVIKSSQQLCTPRRRRSPPLVKEEEVVLAALVSVGNAVLLVSRCAVCPSPQAFWMRYLYMPLVRLASLL